MKNGTSINKMHTGNLYIRISAGPQRNRYVHQLVAEAKIGRPLRKDETVDHIDGDTLNNDPENIEVVSRKENTRRMMIRRNGFSNFKGE